MSTPLSQFTLDNDLAPYLLSPMQIQGIIMALAISPHFYEPNLWVPMMWGNQEPAPFHSHEQLEQFANILISQWEQQHQALLSNQWHWPKECTFCLHQGVNLAARDFCEGLLQGWAITQKDWDALIAQDQQENALLGGVLLSISLLFDPQSALTEIEQENSSNEMQNTHQLKEIFDAMPIMLSGLAMRAHQMAHLSNNNI